jgi:polysaccharide export outer membrane protein
MEYKIGPGDQLEVFVWRSAELSVTVPVRPDGKISTPLVEDMVAAGKTPSDLARDMEVVLAEYLRTPKVNIIVAAQGSANQIQVLGEVNSQLSLPYRDGMRLLDVVVAAGGLGEFAAGNRAKLVRTSGQSKLDCPVRLQDLMEGDLSQNIEIYPGDVLIVPPSRF